MNKWLGVIGRLSIILIVTCLFACGVRGRPDYDSLLDGLPRVLSVVPTEDDILGIDGSVEVTFSVPLLIETVNASSFAILPYDEGKNKMELVDDVIDGDLFGVDGAISFHDDDTKIVFAPDQQFLKGKSYLVIITSKVMSKEWLPLTQHPGVAGSPFVSSFKVGLSSGDEVAESSYSDDPESDLVERIRPNYLIINEILYDAVGSDTDGDVFIELYGEVGGDISDYVINLVNGDDGIIKDTIRIPENTLISDDGIFLIADAKTGQSGVSDVLDADLIDNFDPQNGPDCVQLLNHEGTLLDAVGYGDGIVALAENGLPCFETSSTAKVSSGQSLSRELLEDTDNNFEDFTILEEPTPGKP